MIDTLLLKNMLFELQYKCCVEITILVENCTALKNITVVDINTVKICEVVSMYTVVAKG